MKIIAWDKIPKKNKYIRKHKLPHVILTILEEIGIYIYRHIHFALDCVNMKRFTRLGVPGQISFSRK